MAPFAGHANWSATIPNVSAMSISTRTTPTGWPTTAPPARRSGDRPQGQVTHFVAGLGTSGTFMGTSRHLKEQNPAIQAISVQPDSPFHGLEGLKYMGTSIVPAIYNPHLADREST